MVEIGGHLRKSSENEAGVALFRPLDLYVTIRRSRKVTRGSQHQRCTGIQRLGRRMADGKPMSKQASRRT